MTLCKVKGQSRYGPAKSINQSPKDWKPLIQIRSKPYDGRKECNPCSQSILPLSVPPRHPGAATCPVRKTGRPPIRPCKFLQWGKYSLVFLLRLGDRGEEGVSPLCHWPIQTGLPLKETEDPFQDLLSSLALRDNIFQNKFFPPVLVMPLAFWGCLFGCCSST